MFPPSKPLCEKALLSACSGAASAAALQCGFLFSSQGHRGEVPFRVLRNGAVVHYGASISGVNWAGIHAKLLAVFDTNCRWSRPASPLFSLNPFPRVLCSPSSLHAQCLPVKSYPTGNQWSVMRALWLCCVQGFVPKLLLLVKLNRHVSFCFLKKIISTVDGKRNKFYFQ